MTTNPTRQTHAVHRGTYGPAYQLPHEATDRDTGLDTIEWESEPWEIENGTHGTIIRHESGDWTIIYDHARLSGGQIEHAVHLIPSHSCDEQIEHAIRTEGFAFASTAADYIMQLMRSVDNSGVFRTSSG